MPTLDEAIYAIRTGNKTDARRQLEELLEADETNEEIWLWLTSVVDNDEDREVCLENVLTLNPNNNIARASLSALQNGRFNANDIRDALLVEMGGVEEEEELDDGLTFLDEFQLSSRLEDDELVMPSTMATGETKGAAPGKKKSSAAKKSKRGFNVRALLLVALVLVVLLILGGLAVSRLLLGGGEGAPAVPTEPPGQAVPGGGEEATPVPEDTPTPESTATPTATDVPVLVLPTRRPTDLPTPTATPVVPPTPG